MAAIGEDRHRGARPEELGERAREREVAPEPDERAKGAVGDRPEALDFVPLLGKRLHHAHAADRLVEGGGELGHALLCAAARAAELLPEGDDEESARRHHEQRDQGERHRDPEHPEEIGEEEQQLAREDEHPGGDRAAHERDVVRDARDESAGPTAVKEVEGECREMGEEPPAEIAHHELLQAKHGELLHVPREPLHEEDHEHREAHPAQRGHRVRREEIAVEALGHRLDRGTASDRTERVPPALGNGKRGGRGEDRPRAAGDRHGSAGVRRRGCGDSWSRNRGSVGEEGAGERRHQADREPGEERKGGARGHGQDKEPLVRQDVAEEAPVETKTHHGPDRRVLRTLLRRLLLRLGCVLHL